MIQKTLNTPFERSKVNRTKKTLARTYQSHGMVSKYKQSKPAYQDKQSILSAVQSSKGIPASCTEVRSKSIPILSWYLSPPSPTHQPNSTKSILSPKKFPKKIFQGCCFWGPKTVLILQCTSNSKWVFLVDSLFCNIKYTNEKTQFLKTLLHTFTKPTPKFIQNNVISFLPTSFACRGTSKYKALRWHLKLLYMFVRLAPIWWFHFLAL